MLCVGNLHLTTHRFTFHAVLPPLALLDSSSSASSLIIKSGPVWIHRPGRLTKKRRVWLELGIDMMSTFPDSSKEGRTRPLKSLICQLPGGLSSQSALLLSLTGYIFDAQCRPSSTSPRLIRRTRSRSA